ncbi:MAG: hypothetical protein AMQ22_00555 [Candidatus Methanofastidiosum methylothiophilum]|uniref:Beta-propeller repeat protein n=1 Tax=Candidatus Methanofastidiosum methylothiophilum TaxID=1705564 RepID=A0A150J6M3_9EURY|nr:MAG: hypothetical protein AMQ22_00555 [Candidatus Methanofastidiosum methylthiophilus]
MKKIISILIISIFLISLSSVYAAEGDALWQKLGPNGYAYGVAVDSKDNIIVTGTGGTIKYNSNGNLLKEISFDGYDVEVDSKDNIIVTGGDGTMKFDPNGNGIWASAIDFDGEGIAVDSNDNILVDDGYFTTRKYSSSGTFIWEKIFDSGGNYDYSYGVAADSFDNVIVSGYNGNDVSSWASIIVKYSPDGTKLWDIIDDIEPRWSYKVAVDSYNNIIAAGGRYISYDWLTKKYDPNGNKIWEKGFDFAGISDDQGWAVAVDSKNDIIVTGWVNDGGTRKYFTIKYQGVPPRNKSLPIAQILKILKLNKEK